jgi:hypothetical protein
MNAEQIEEKAQGIVLEAIKKIRNVSDPARYASMNYSVYEVAMEAVKQALQGNKKK